MREDVKHVRQLMTENQKAMLSLVKAITCMQDEMTHLGANVCSLISEGSSSVRHALSSLPDDDVTSERSDKRRRGPFATFKASLRRKRQHSTGDTTV